MFTNNTSLEKLPANIPETYILASILMLFYMLGLYTNLPLSISIILSIVQYFTVKYLKHYISLLCLTFCIGTLCKNITDMLQLNLSREETALIICILFVLVGLIFNSYTSRNYDAFMGSSVIYGNAFITYYVITIYYFFEIGIISCIIIYILTNPIVIFLTFESHNLIIQNIHPYDGILALLSKMSTIITTLIMFVVINTFVLLRHYTKCIIVNWKSFVEHCDSLEIQMI